MSSKIDPSQINQAFPVSDINQSSQGFRSNFSAIQSNFSIAKLELSTLQATTISLSGDVVNTGQPPTLNQSTPYQIPLVVELSSIMANASTIDTTKNDYQISVDTKGRITSVITQNRNSYTGDGVVSTTVTLNTEDPDYKSSTGIASMSVPDISINQYGEITNVEYTSIDNFGLLGYSMSKGSILAGSTLGKSTFLPSYTSISGYDSTKTYYLVSNTNTETGLSWSVLNLPTNVVESVVGTNGIVSTTNGSEVDLSFSVKSLSEITTELTDANKIVVSTIDSSNNETIGYTTFSNILSNNINGLFLKKVSDDTSPSLGGTLNIGINPINSTGTATITGTSGINLSSTANKSNGIVLNSANMSSTLAPSSYYISNTVGNLFDVTSSSITTSNIKNVTFNITDSSSNNGVLSLDITNGFDLDINQFVISGGGSNGNAIISSSNDLSISSKTMELTSPTVTISGSGTLDVKSFNSIVLEDSNSNSYTSNSSGIVIGNSTSTVTVATGNITSTIGSSSLVMNSTTSTLSSPTIALTSSTALKLNGVTYPQAVPTSDGSILMYNSDGSTSYTVLSSTIISVDATDGLSAVVDGQKTTVSLDYSTMTLVNDTSLTYKEIVVYNPSTKKTELVTFDSLLDGSNVAYVSSTGDDTYGTGAFYRPYATITKALTSSSNIVLFPGSYNENISITNSNINITSTDPENTRLNGNITIGTGVSDLYVYGITMIYVAGTSTTYILDFADTISSSVFEKCIFLGTQNEELLKISGSVSDTILFKNCDMTGIVENAITSGTVSIDGYHTGTGDIRIISSGSGNTNISNLKNIVSITHSSGDMSVYNVGKIYDSYNQKNVIINNKSYVTSESIISTSSSTSDVLSLNSCSLFNQESGYFGQINKTGTCQLSLTNVLRDQQSDILTGTMIVPDEVYEDADPIHYISATTSNTDIIPYADCCYVEIDADTTITLGTPLFENSYYSYIKEMRLILSGTGLGKATISSTNVINNGGFEEVFQGELGNQVLYELLWNSEIEKWIIVDYDILNNSNYYTINSDTILLNGDSSTKRLQSFSETYIDFTSSNIDVHANSVSFSGFIAKNVQTGISASGSTITSGKVLFSQINDVTNANTTGEIQTLSSPTSTYYTSAISENITPTATSGSGTGLELLVNSSIKYLGNNLLVTNSGSGYAANDTIGTHYGTVTVTTVDANGSITAATIDYTGGLLTYEADEVNIAQTSNSGSGTNALFGITSTEVYVIDNIAILSGGSGYAVNDTVTTDIGTLTVSAVYTSGTSLVLPEVDPGVEIVIFNRTGDTLTVFPQSATSKIENNSAGASVNILDSTKTIFTSITSTLWRIS